jgi:3-dehydroquinate dehydratase type I
LEQEQLRSKICVSIAETSVGACIAALHDVELAEVRLDSIQALTIEQARSIFEHGARTVATCRPGRHDDAARAALLIAAVEAGARYVDVELDAGATVRDRVVSAARSVGCDVIVSHHDPETTPLSMALRNLVDACFSAGADVAKIACRANGPRDAARLLGLLDDARRLVVIGMGVEGVVTRVMGPLLGSELTFAAARAGAETAPGQLDAAELERRMRVLLNRP